MKNIKLLDIIIFLFVSLFIYAATSKLIEYDIFQAQIGKSPLIMQYSKYITFLIPGLEIIISLLLIIKKTQLLALYASFSLMLLFTLYIIFILNFSPYVPCSCGGILSKMGWTEHMIFNIAFTILSIAGIYLNVTETSQEAKLAI